jgi:uncharacterized protein YndB with AHSA1/START domain
MARGIRFEISIDAPAETVWGVVSDLARYPEWNPFVIDASSTFEVGSPIRMRVRLFPPFSQNQTETITEHVAGQKVCWGLKGGGSPALRSRRCQVVETMDGGRTRYVSEFQLTGWLAPLVMVILGRRLEAGFRGMSMGVKARAEELSGRGATA